MQAPWPPVPPSKCSLKHKCPLALAASMPLATFVANFADHVKDYVKDQDFTEWTQIAFCTSGSANSEPADEFDKLAKLSPGTRPFGEFCALFTKACYIEFGTPAPPGSCTNPVTPPPITKVALLDARSPLEKGVDGKGIYLENPHHTTDQGYCMTLEYYQERYDALKEKVFWLPPNMTPSKRFLGLLLRHLGHGFFEASKWSRFQLEKYATPETKQPRQVGHSNMYALPKMKEPVPRDMEHAVMQIDACMRGVFMAEILRTSIPSKLSWCTFGTMSTDTKAMMRPMDADPSWAKRFCTPGKCFSPIRRRRPSSISGQSC